MDDATPPQFKRGRGRPPMLPNGLKAQKLDGGQWKDELGNIWNHREAVATARKRAVEKYSAKKKRERAAARATQETPRAAPRSRPPLKTALKKGTKKQRKAGANKHHHAPDPHRSSDEESEEQLIHRRKRPKAAAREAAAASDAGVRRSRPTVDQLAHVAVCI